MIAQPDLESPSGLKVVTTDKAARKRRRLPRIRIHASAWVYIGITIAVGGVGLIGYAWGKVAGVLNVALQIPYLISAGLIGLALTAVGVAIAHFASQHIDAMQRARELQRQADLLQAIANELRAALGDNEEGQ